MYVRKVARIYARKYQIKVARNKGKNVCKKSSKELCYGVGARKVARK